MERRPLPLISSNAQQLLVLMAISRQYGDDSLLAHNSTNNSTNKRHELALQQTDFVICFMGSASSNCRFHSREVKQWIKQNGSNNTIQLTDIAISRTMIDDLLRLE